MHHLQINKNRLINNILQHSMKGRQDVKINSATIVQVQYNNKRKT